MADIRNLFKAMAPEYALRNARREAVEHARIVAEVEALVLRIGPSPESFESLEASRRAS